ncbi:MAG: hypothetical protein R6V83_08270 [Candidatus Thorarchaeota archaeon]
MPDENNEEIAESDKLTEKDKQEIQEGACVNCAIAVFLLAVATLSAMLL